MPATTVYYPGSVNNWYGGFAQAPAQVPMQVPMQAPVYYQPQQQQNAEIFVRDAYGNLVPMVPRGPVAYGWGMPLQQPVMAMQVAPQPEGYPTSVLGAGQALGPQQAALASGQSGGMKPTQASYGAAHSGVKKQQSMRYSY